MAAERPSATLRRIYVGGVVCVGAGVVIQSIATVSQQPVDLGWVALALLTLISGSFTVRIPGATSTISVSETFVIIAAVKYGPGAAAILVALEGLIVSLWILKNTREAYRVFFNMATGGVSVWLSAHLFFVFAPQPLVLETPASIVAIIPALFAFAASYFLINSWLIALAISLDSGRSAWQIWRNAFVLLSLNYVSGASLAALLLPFIESVGLTSISLIAPLMVLAYVTFRTAMGRIADANNHLSELNKLYLSTIETLAMAIDAKDQITHGHVRRVQAYATGLARAVGVESESELKAIEAAALLHDMGKLAIPEHILNKPGKLTTAEFETMKQHANIGADILSAIDFPYPVVPIVRYHHENWDGNGYPEGLTGESIPIGARILSVVDCFDALTSDRPYRPRLAEAEALEILRERSGNMYDPALVETFARIYRSIAPADAQLDSDAQGTHIHDSQQQETPRKDRRTTLDSISSSTAEARMLYELGQALGGTSMMRDVAEVISSHLRRFVPTSTFVWFVYNQNQDQLQAQFVSGQHADSISGMPIAVGERISGWVAANRRSALNSDPALDLGDIAKAGTPRLMSCLASPVTTDDELVGVITLYSSKKEAFSDQHLRIVEMVAAQSAGRLQQGLREGQALTPTATSGLLNLDKLERTFDRARETGDVSLMIVAADRLDDKTVLALLGILRSELRESDEVIQSGSREFFVIMPKTDGTTCRSMEGHIYKALTSRTREAAPAVVVSSASGPQDGNSLFALIETARGRLGPAAVWASNRAAGKAAIH